MQKVNLVISDQQKVIVRKEITQSTYLTDTISFVQDRNGVFSVHYESDSGLPWDLSPASGQKPSFFY